MSDQNYDQVRLSRQADQACHFLFDRWCHERNVIPLSYLLHSWPIASNGQAPLKRLAATLNELRKLHAEIIEADILPTLSLIVQELENNSYYFCDIV